MRNAGVAAQFPDVPPDFEYDDEHEELWQRSEGDPVSLEWKAEEMGRRRPANRWHIPSWNRARKLVDRCTSHVDAMELQLLQVSSTTAPLHDGLNEPNSNVAIVSSRRSY